MDANYLDRQRKYREKTGNAATKKYERTQKGKLMRLYRNMQSRITGIQKQKAHLYVGKELLSKEEFYQWAEASPDWDLLYSDWVQSGFDRKFAPTVDRIDSSKGYTPANMRWLTHSENSRLGGKWSPKMRKENE